MPVNYDSDIRILKNGKLDKPINARPVNGDILLFEESTNRWEAQAPSFASSSDLYIAAWSPVLKGATDDPVVTYTNQSGSVGLAGRICFITVDIVTSTMTKTTTSDAIRIDLPFPSRDWQGVRVLLPASAYNATPVQVANQAVILPNTNYLTLMQQSLTAAPSNITYGALSIGVLTNTITFRVSGCYQI